MYPSNEIHSVHLEVTSKCNASCPMCLRNVLGGKVNPNLPITELRLTDVQKILPSERVRRLHRLYMCGNYGDPIMAQDTVEIFSYLRASNPQIRLQMFTNGSGRGEDWWRRLAQLQVEVRFSVDGLEDTNAIYRRGTKWPLILRAMKAFISAGGRAEWDFIVFKHNEHQVEEAEKLARALEFHAFHVKKTARFFSNIKVEGKDRQEVKNTKGEIEYYLEKPTSPRYLNSALKKEDDIVAEFGSLKNFFGRTPIDCKAAHERSLFITAEGHAFPCCWTANQLYPWYFAPKSTPIWRMIESLPEGIESLNAKIHPLDEILANDFFQNAVPRSWEIEGFENGRLFVCGKACGRGLDAFKAQFAPTPAPSTPSA
jgi:MoaA/NifB/PqqE/SkfB family radical SAM enzyme